MPLLDQPQAARAITLGSVGYERHKSVDNFAALLADSGIERLIDGRELPISRRRGFAKSAFSEAFHTQRWACPWASPHELIETTPSALSSNKEGVAFGMEASAGDRRGLKEFREELPQGDYHIASELLVEGGGPLRIIETYEINELTKANRKIETDLLMPPSSRGSNRLFLPLAFLSKYPVAPDLAVTSDTGQVLTVPTGNNWDR